MTTSDHRIYGPRNLLSRFIFIEGKYLRASTKVPAQPVGDVRSFTHYQLITGLGASQEPSQIYKTEPGASLTFPATEAMEALVWLVMCWPDPCSMG